MIDFSVSVRVSMLSYHFALIMASTIFLSGCNTGEKVENSALLAKEIQSKKIKRITTTELNATLHNTGQKVAALATNLLEKDSLTQIRCGTASHSIKELNQLSQKLGVEVGLLFAGDTSNSALFPKENELLHAYLYQVLHGLEISDNLQRLNDTLSVFYAPLGSGSPVFTRCEDAAGSPFALWRILLNQKTVIRNLDL